MRRFSVLKREVANEREPLESEQIGAECPDRVLAGHREVWTSTHGWAGKLHIALDGQPMAACSPARTLKGSRRIILGDLIEASEVPSHQRCQHPACRKRWPNSVSSPRLEIS
jgi:hypothetical protein